MSDPNKPEVSDPDLQKLIDMTWEMFGEVERVRPDIAEEIYKVPLADVRCLKLLNEASGLDLSPMEKVADTLPLFLAKLRTLPTMKRH